MTEDSPILRGALYILTEHPEILIKSSILGHHGSTADSLSSRQLLISNIGKNIAHTPLLIWWNPFISVRHLNTCMSGPRLNSLFRNSLPVHSSCARHSKKMIGFTFNPCFKTHILHILIYCVFANRHCRKPKHALFFRKFLQGRVVECILFNHLFNSSALQLSKTSVDSPAVIFLSIFSVSNNLEPVLPKLLLFWLSLLFSLWKFLELFESLSHSSVTREKGLPSLKTLGSAFLKATSTRLNKDCEITIPIFTTDSTLEHYTAVLSCTHTHSRLLLKKAILQVGSSWFAIAM